MRTSLLVASCLALVSALLVSPGCNLPKIEASQMVTDYNATSRLSATCSVKILPSQSMSLPNLSLLFDPSEFGQALDESLNKSGMFSHLVDESNLAAQYRLVVSLREVHNGFLYSRWVLTRADKAVIWDADYAVESSLSSFANAAKRVNAASKATIDKALTSMDLALRKSPASR